MSTMPPLSLAKPVATLTVQPTGARAAAPREHAITLTLELSPHRPRHADKDQVLRVARHALEVFAPADGQPDRRRFGDVLVTTRSRKTGPRTAVVAVEGSAPWRDRPVEDAVAAVRDSVVAEGYRLALREQRECAAPGCKVVASVEWDHAAEVPRGWHNSGICGAHNYRTCARCKTMVALTSANSVGPAPALHCEVCGLVIIEWGSSKIWYAEPLPRAAT